MTTLCHHLVDFWNELTGVTGVEIGSSEYSHDAKKVKEAVWYVWAQPDHHKTTVGMFLRNSLAICHTRQSLPAKSNLLPDAFDRAPVAARCLRHVAQCPVVGVSGHGGSIAEWSRASPAQLDTPQGQNIVNKAMSGTEALGCTLLLPDSPYQAIRPMASQSVAWLLPLPWVARSSTFTIEMKKVSALLTSTSGLPVGLGDLTVPEDARTRGTDREVNLQAKSADPSFCHTLSRSHSQAAFTTTAAACRRLGHLLLSRPSNTCSLWTASRIGADSRPDTEHRTLVKLPHPLHPHLLQLNRSFRLCIPYQSKGMQSHLKHTGLLRPSLSNTRNKSISPFHDLTYQTGLEGQRPLQF